MKKTNTVIIILLTLFIEPSFAQSNNDLPQACFIAKAGVNLSTLNNNYFYSSNAQPGFQVGADFRTDGDFFLLGGVQYTAVNPVITYDGTGTKDEVGMSYFQVPVLCGLHIVKSKDRNTLWHATLGGSFTTLLSVSDNHLGISKDYLKTFGFTVKTGVGVDHNRFHFGINYNLLITKVFDYAGYNNKAKLMSWEFIVGYRFPVNLGSASE